MAAGQPVTSLGPMAPKNLQHFKRPDRVKLTEMNDRPQEEELDRRKLSLAGRRAAPSHRSSDNCGSDRLRR